MYSLDNSLAGLTYDEELPDTASTPIPASNLSRERNGSISSNASDTSSVYSVAEMTPAELALEAARKSTSDTNV
ncbi:MAG UNVERIFIED_CONTAM: hypothetical protein LVQ98_06855 [Rickettsiaceae bacterium]|jgi:hypothetical protein